MKKMTALILALLMALSLTACGGGAPSNEEAAAPAPAAADDGAVTEPEPTDTLPEEASDAEAPAEEESEADTSAENGPINDAEPRLLSFYHTEDSTYIMAAYPDPSNNYYYGGFSAGDESLGWYTADHGGWTVAFAQADGAARPIEDFTLHVGGRDEERNFTFSEEDMVSPEEYADFGLYRMGGRYVTLGKSLKYLYESRRAFCRLDIYVCDVAMLDQNSRLSESDISADAFALYAGDGTPAEALLGTPCVFSHGGFFENDYMTTVSVYLDFFPYEDTGMKEEQEPAAQQMLESLMETEPYFTYTDPQGNVFTFPLEYEDIPPAYRS